jgi:hypothetical protein
MKPRAGDDVEQIVDITECLTWTGNTFESHEDRELRRVINQHPQDLKVKLWRAGELV